MQKGAVGSSGWMKVQLARYNSQEAISASVGCPSKQDCDQEVPHELPPKHLSSFCNTAKVLPWPGAEHGHFQTQFFPPRRLLGGVCLFHSGGQEKALFDRGKWSQLPTAVLLPRPAPPPPLASREISLGSLPPALPECLPTSWQPANTD